MSSYDLTSKVSPFLDRHLVFPLLEFLQDRQIYAESEILRAKIELLAKTNMVDYAMDIHKSLTNSEDVPQSMIDRRADVVARLKSLEESAAPLINFLQDPALVQELRGDKQYNLQMLQEQHQITSDHVEGLYQYAKFQFECGNYSGAADYLYQYHSLCSNPERAFNAMWGKLAAEILMQNWEGAMDELTRLKDVIDTKTFSSPLVLLQQRTWLLHWSLFIFFNTPNGRNNLVDLFLQDKYLNALQTNAPHLLRYLAVAAMAASKRRRNVVKELVRVVEQEVQQQRQQQEEEAEAAATAGAGTEAESTESEAVTAALSPSQATSDPILDFVMALFVDSDFDTAQQKLKECEELLANDFFLGKQEESNGVTVLPLRDEFLDSARQFLFESICRLYSRIKLSTVAERLGMRAEDAEQWAMDLITGSKLDAKIDLQEGTLVMQIDRPSIYETAIEKSKTLASRTYNLANGVAAAASSLVATQ